MSVQRRIRVRPGRTDDVDALYALARAGGVGLTNLPPDREVLAKKLAAGVQALRDPGARAAGSAVMLVTECDDAIVGTGCVFARVGAEWPFYSYRLTRQAQTSRAVGRVMEQRLLNLANDFDGEAEVGGLFVDPAARGAAVGALTARTRYLFIARHRAWFKGRVIAEMRGWQDDAGGSPVWEAIGRHFYAMDFHEADRVNAVEGNQFIADLGPRHPIYTSLLPSAAQAALGRPHDDGRRAYELLIEEGFRDEGYVDIFDGGPTLTADIDALRAVREGGTAHAEVAAAGAPGDALSVLVAAGEGEGFRAAALSARVTDGAIRLPPEAFDRLEITPGALVSYARHAGRPTAAAQDPAA